MVILCFCWWSEPTARGQDQLNSVISIFFWFGDVKSDTHIHRYETSSDDRDTDKTFSDVVSMKDWQELVVKWDEFLHCVYHAYHWQMDCD